METLKTRFVALAIVGFVYMALEKRAHSEPLHHEVQVVTGGRVDSQAFVDAVRDEVSRFISGAITVYVVVNPHPGATTVSVTIVGARLMPRHYGRLRLVIEAVPRVPGVVRNGYSAIRQRISVATASSRL